MIRRGRDHASSPDEDSQREEEEQSESESESESESDEGIDTDEEQEVLDKLHAQMEDVPFEEQLRAKRDGSTAAPKTNPNAKRRSARILRESVEDADDDGLNTVDRRKEKNRRQKRPRELSAKVRVSKKDGLMNTSLFHITEQSSIKTRDPRFDDMSGDFNQVQFDKAYGFLDDFRMRERDAIQSELERLKKGKKGKEETVLSLQRELSVLESEISRSKRRKRMQEIRSEHRKKELELVREKGKTPYHLKESVLKKMVDDEELRSLRGTKKFRKRIERKKRKRIAKEETPMPFYQETP